MKKNKGFTLIELMVVVIIIGIVIAVGLPSYQQYLIESKRRTATGALVALEARMQRFYVNSGRTYVGANTAIGLTSGTSDSIDTEDYNYNVVIQANTAGVAGQAFTLSATARGSQVNDTGCTVMSINNTGAKTPTACW